MNTRRIARQRRPRSGISLIEVVVACTLLALTLTGLTGLYVRLSQRNRNSAIVEQRNATLGQEMNRVATLPYDSITTSTTSTVSNYLVNDSVKVGAGYYVWKYSIDPESSGTLATTKYRKIKLTVVPRLDTTTKQVVIIRREKVPYRNVFNTGS
jgi:type II secretory pathway pseudopilin PulG